METNIDPLLYIARMINVETPYVVKEEEKPVKKKPSKKLEKYLNNTAAKAPNGKILKKAVLYDMLTKAAPYKGHPSLDGTDVNKEFQKALDKGKKYGMHLSKNGGDPFLSELEKLASFDPLKSKI